MLGWLSYRKPRRTPPIRLRHPATTMKYLSILALIAIPLAASADKLRVDTTYDNPALPADELTCYDSYLSPKGYTIIGDVLSYPNMAGYSKIANASSPFCGSCCFSGFNFVTNAHGSPLPRCLHQCVIRKQYRQFESGRWCSGVGQFNSRGRGFGPYPHHSFACMEAAPVRWFLSFFPELVFTDTYRSEIDEIGPDQFLDVQALQVDSSACDPELHKKCVDC